jgi:cystathionine beta-lyase
MTNKFDAIDIDSLRRVGGVKWSRFPGTIGAFVAEMDFGVAPPIADALHKAIDDAMFGYLPAKLATEMSAACADWQRTTYGWDVEPGRVHPIADVLKGLEVAIEHYSRPGAPVILPTPAYMPFLTVPKALGREIIEVPLRFETGRHTFDLDGLDRAFAAGGSLMILCNPYNPVGRVFERAELEAVAEIVDRHGGRVFSDEIHSPLVYAGARHVPYASISPTAAGHTLTATSASKAWNLPGLKCAQLILSNAADAALWEKVGPDATHGASNLGVIANTVAYRAGRDWLAEVMAYLDGNRRELAALLAEHLPQVRYEMPEGTYIAWLDCRGLGLNVSPAAFFREKAGVSLTDGASCGGPGDGFVRLIFATPRPILRQAIRQMGAALAR